MDFKYIAIFSCLFLLIFLLYKEVRRTNKDRLIWRILASIIAVACFMLLMVPVKYETHIKKNSNEIVLLTEGTNLDSVAKVQVEKYVLASADLKRSKAKSIADLPYFLATHQDIRKLDIYGYGLSEEELKATKGYEVNFHPSENPQGIISASWQHKIKTSEQLTVQGVYQNTGKNSIKLLLKGLGNAIDSISIGGKSNKNFSFQTRPKQTGKAVYQLIALQGKDTLAIEPVPFLVGNQSPMKVLILASFPDFEYKFLKKWLYENQYPVAFRTQISKNKFSSDFLNIESFNLNKINSSALKKFDVLIIDEEELAAINPEEIASINAAVTGGLGLLVRVSSPKSTAPISGTFGRGESAPAKDQQLSISLKENKYNFSKLPLAQSLFLKTTENDQPLVMDGSGRTLVNSSLKGSGKISMSTIPATFNWLLSGKKTDYSTYWSAILSNAARRKTENQTVKIIPQFPVVSEQTRLVIDLAESGKIPALKIDSINLAPRQNIALPFQWDAVFWPSHSGWRNLSINQSIESLFIYKKSDWLARRNQQKINSNLEFVKALKNIKPIGQSKDLIIEKEISIWWFFIGFLVASAFLWIESRIFNDK